LRTHTRQHADQSRLRAFCPLAASQYALNISAVSKISRSPMPFDAA